MLETGFQSLAQNVFSILGNNLSRPDVVTIQDINQFMLLAKKIFN